MKTNTNSRIIAFFLLIVVLLFLLISARSVSARPHGSARDTLNPSYIEGAERYFPDTSDLSVLGHYLAR